MQGTIKTVIPAKGFGFIRRSNGEPDLFFHFRQCDFGAMPFDEQLTEREVTFTETTDHRNGKPMASDVRFAR
ncbi:MAG TPA: cold shock domain-containing protein [Planctomycetaceae bacterium]|nr:cold shock domain-containing protein [Planctomycetaceae bacterium]